MGRKKKIVREQQLGMDFRVRNNNGGAGYTTFEAMPCYFDPQGYPTLLYSGDPIKHLFVTAQGTDAERERGIYAWNFRMNSPVSGFGLTLIQEAAAAMANIKKRLDSYYEQEGRVHSFGHYVLRVARAIGAEFVTLQSEGDTNEWVRYYLHNAEAVIRAIDRQIDQWQKGEVYCS